MQKTLNLYTILIFVFSFNLGITFSKQTIIQESDSIYFQSIYNLEFSPNNELFCVNPKGSSKKLAVFNKDGNLYKSFTIDDSFTNESFEIIVENVHLNDSVFDTPTIKKIMGVESDVYKNSFSRAVFVNDSMIYVTARINYYTQVPSTDNKIHVKLNRNPVIIKFNILTGDKKITKLLSYKGEIFPQADYLKIINNSIYLRLFPKNYFKKKAGALKFVLGKFDLDSNSLVPILEVPHEYEKYNTNLTLNYRYRVAELNNTTYFVAPFTNYTFNDDGDTIKFKGLEDPIFYSLSKNKSEKIESNNDYYKLEDISYNIIDFFFFNQKVNLILQRTNEADRKVYIYTYDLSGDFIEESVLLKEKIESIFYSKNKQKIIKVYIQNDEWYFEELNVN